MPSIPVNSPLSYLGIFVFIFGAFLVLSGLNIIRIEKVTVTPGRRTWGLGLAAVFTGLALLSIDQQLTRKLASAAVPTPTAVAPAAPTLAQESASKMPATLATVQSIPVTVLDDFSNNRSGWRISSGEDGLAVWNDELTGGKYRIGVKAKTDVLHRSPNFLAQDLWLGVDALLVESDATEKDTAVILTLRDNTDLRFYVAYFYLDSFYSLVWRSEKENPRSIIERTYHPALRFDRGEPLRLGVLAEGAHFTLFANGEPLAAVEDGTFNGPGKIGIGVATDAVGKSITVDFDNLELRKIR